MAAHVAADDLESMLFFGKIGCFKEAHGAFHAHVLQPKQVLKAAPQIQRQGQNRRIGRNNVARRVGTLRQRRKAEGLVLIIKLWVKGMTTAFADPVNAARPVRLLLPQGGFQSGGQQRARNWRLKQQGRHILGQGTVTGEQTLSPAYAHRDTAQPVPVAQRDLFGHDGVKTEQPRFTGQQVMMAAAFVRLVWANLDPEKLRFFIKQDRKIHTLGQRVRPGGEIVKRFRQNGQQCPKPLCTGGQTHRQLAAVRREDMGRRQRFQSPGIVPAVQVPLPFGQHFQRGDGLANSTGRFRSWEQTQFFCCQQGDQIQPDTGGRGAVRNAFVGFDLHIVGGQTVGFVGDGGLKVQHGSGCQAGQHLPHILRGPGRYVSRCFQQKQQEGQRRPAESGNQPRQKETVQKNGKRRHAAGSQHT